MTQRVRGSSDIAGLGGVSDWNHRRASRLSAPAWGERKSGET
jgi:hypothetical protein